MAYLYLKEGVVVLFAGTALAVVLNVVYNYVARLRSPIRRLRGPPKESFTYGNLMQVVPENAGMHLKWFKEYGPNLCASGLLMTPHLWTIDTRVINHVLTHSHNYYKPIRASSSLRRIIGEHGLLVTEGEKHRRQRRVVNPAFGPVQIRDLTEVFLAKANDLCTYWKTQHTAEGGHMRVNVSDGLGKMTLDVIGLAGFDYHFEAMNTDLGPNELNEAFHGIFKQPPKLTIFANLANSLPLLAPFRDERTKRTDAASITMRKLGRQILEERKAQILREKSGNLEKKDVQGRDLLTLLVCANMATDIPDNQRMTDEEVIAQIPTFVVAGHETTSTSTSWCLFALACNPAIQRKLREELVMVDTDMPTMEELNVLPYLDKVVHESLRLYAPVTGINRVAMQDDVIPTNAPYTDRDGNVCNEICVKKGDKIFLMISALHTSQAIWGDDALEYKPERWESPPEAVSSIPGVWGHLLTFIGGSHACIGYRFSVVEMKALVFTLVRTFEFELAGPAEDVTPTGLAIQRPALRSEIEKGPQLPLLLRPYKG